MDKLTNLPNIGKTLAKKLNRIGINNKNELEKIGSENAFIKISAIENSGVCLNMLCALEGAIQGIRWHDLNAEKKQELKYFYQSMNK